MRPTPVKPGERIGVVVQDPGQKLYEEIKKAKSPALLKSAPSAQRSFLARLMREGWSYREALAEWEIHQDKEGGL